MSMGQDIKLIEQRSRSSQSSSTCTADEEDKSSMRNSTHIELPSSLVHLVVVIFVLDRRIAVKPSLLAGMRRRRVDERDPLSLLVRVGARRPARRQ